MIKINVGGMVTKEVRDLISQIGGDKVQAQVTTDIAGVKEVAAGNADYYLGACATGGGGALSMAIAILGYMNCFTVSAPGKPPKAEEVQKAVTQGKKAFGFTSDHVNIAVPMIVEAILAKHDQQS